MGPVGDFLENANLSLSAVSWVGMGGQMKELLPYLQAFRRKKKHALTGQHPKVCDATILDMITVSPQKAAFSYRLIQIHVLYYFIHVHAIEVSTFN